VTHAIRVSIVISLAAMAATAQPAPLRLTLRQALELAEKQSPDLQLAALGALEAQANAESAKSAYRPQLAIAVSNGYQTSNLEGIGLVLPGAPSRMGPYRVFNARPQLTAPLIDLSLLSSIRAAGERSSASKYDAETVRQTTLLAVLELAIDYFQADSRIAAASARLDTAHAVLRQTGQAEAAGTASKLDLARAAQQVYTEQASLAEAKRDRDVVRAMLAKTIGLDQTDAIELEAPELLSFASRARSADSIASGALEQRSELEALNARRNAAVYDRQAAARERLPKLAFSGDYGVTGAGPDRSLSTYTVGASLSIPVFTGGRIRAEVQAAQARMAQTERRLHKEKLQIAEEVHQAAIESDAAREMLSAATGAVGEARRALELSRLRFGAGLVSSVDVATAQSAYAQADDFAIRTRYDWYRAEARLARAEGDVYWFFDRGTR
jgi:outer membrane protein